MELFYIKDWLEHNLSELLFEKANNTTKRRAEYRISKIMNMLWKRGKVDDWNYKVSVIIPNYITPYLNANIEMIHYNKANENINMRIG